MSKLHDDLINEVEPHETADDSVRGLLLAIADRIEGCNGSMVKLSDLCAVLREDPDKVSKAILANTNLPGEKVRSTPYDAPSPAFDKPRENVRTAEEAKLEEQTKAAPGEQWPADDTSPRGEPQPA
jgi:hypothetical protein